MGPSRPTEPPDPMEMADATAFTAATLVLIRPPKLPNGVLDLRHTMTLCFRSPPADHPGDHHHPDGWGHQKVYFVGPGPRKSVPRRSPWSKNNHCTARISPRSKMAPAAAIPPTVTARATGATVSER